MTAAIDWIVDDAAAGPVTAAMDWIVESLYETAGDPEASRVFEDA